MIIFLFGILVTQNPPPHKNHILFPVWLGNKILPRSSLPSSHDALNMNFKLSVAGLFICKNNPDP
jgi:hypothetical protein